MYELRFEMYNVESHMKWYTCNKKNKTGNDFLPSYFVYQTSGIESPNHRKDQTGNFVCISTM